MSRARHFRWPHGVLLALTLVTTSVMGAAFVRAFHANVPVDIWEGLSGYREMFHDPRILWTGMPFSVTLMSILLAHEMGHFLACRYYRVNATAPFFIPFPAPIGTFGAFIRIRAPIYSKRTLFDVAVAGPLAGFFLLLPALAVGIAWSKVIPGIAEQGEMLFGVPLIVRLLETAIFPGVPSSDIYLHPIARAAWVGVLATALNLLPIGQLDGGHILYSFSRRTDAHSLENPGGAADPARAYLFLQLADSGRHSCSSSECDTRQSSTPPRLTARGSGWAGYP